MIFTAIFATAIASITSAVSAAGTAITAGAVTAGATAAGAATTGATAALAAAKGMGTIAMKNLATTAAMGAASGVASGTRKELLGSDDSDDAGNKALESIGIGIDLIRRGPVYTCAKKSAEHVTRKVLK